MHQRVTAAVKFWKESVGWFAHNCRWQPGKKTDKLFMFFEHNFGTNFFRTKSLQQLLNNHVSNISSKFEPYRFSGSLNFTCQIFTFRSWKPAGIISRALPCAAMMIYLTHGSANGPNQDRCPCDHLFVNSIRFHFLSFRCLQIPAMGIASIP